MAVLAASALDVMSSPESIQSPSCKAWRSVDSECSTVAQSFSLAFEEDSEPISEKKAQKPETCIIFDWDDTLLPTSFIEDAARMCAPSSSPARRRAGVGRRGASRGLPADFPCYTAIQEHGQLIAKALRLAKKCSDRVAIASLSERPWVFESADQYLPGLDMAELLKELQIPVYYAPEHATTRFPPAETAALEHSDLGSEDLNVTMKRNAMLEFLQLHIGQSDFDGLNLISIGDSLVEKEAAQACARFADLEGKPSLCKTIKLIGDPSLKQLNEQLKTLTSHIETVCSHNCDLDLHAQSPDDLVAQLGTVGPPEPAQ